MSTPHPECPGGQALQVRVAELEVEVAPLRAVVGQLQTRLAQLEARLNQNSSNSSRPPSSDPPAAPARLPRPTPSGRKPGGQPGHPGKTRFLKPIEQCHHHLPVFPKACAHCHAPLPQEPSGDALPPRRHQLLELPPVLIQTIEYQCHATACPHCHALTWATLPPEVPHGIFGPRLQPLCALLVGRHRMSCRSLQEWLWEGGGETVPLGCLIDLEARTTQALQRPNEEVREAVQAAKVINADETPWRAAVAAPRARQPKGEG